MESGRGSGPSPGQRWLLTPPLPRPGRVPPQKNQHPTITTTATRSGGSRSCRPYWHTRHLKVAEAQRAGGSQRPEEALSQEGLDLTRVFPGFPLAGRGEQTVGGRGRSWGPGCCSGPVSCEDSVRSVRIRLAWHPVYAQ